MSLSTQLARGTLALPMLALFAALALAANQASDAQAYVPQPIVVAAHIAEPGFCPLGSRPLLVLAQAPADLGPIAHRQAGACRA